MLKEMMSDKRLFPALACVSMMIMALLLTFAPRQARAENNITLGMSAAFSGPSRGLGIELYRGAMAYFQYVNDKGGINGRQIKILPLDDGYNPLPAIENTIQLMDDPNVLCLFNYVGTPTTTRILPLFKSKRSRDMLLFFPFTGANAFRKPPYNKHIYNLRASYQQEIDGIVDKLLAIGRKRIALFYQADAYGRSGWQALRRSLARQGLSIVSEATYRRGAHFTDNLSDQARIIGMGKPDAIIAVGSYEACAAFIRDARDFGLDVPVANLSFVGSENLLGLLKTAGNKYTRNLINSQVVPSYNDTNLSAVRLYRRLMTTAPPAPPKGFGHGYDPLKFSYVSFEGFLNAVVMTEIVSRLGNRTRSHLPTVLRTMKQFDAGIDTPVRFGLKRHQGLNQVYFTTVRDGNFVTLTDKDWQQWRK